MSNILLVIICSLIGGVVALSGGILLLKSKKRMKFAEYATAFAAGALLAAALTDILPEAIETGEAHQILLFCLLGILAFFIFESSVHWFHHHSTHDEHEKTDPVIPMIIVGDTIHNFIDGVAIAAGFLASPLTGIIVTLAVVAHEIPQEIGDFGLMLNKGLKPKKVFLINIFSALATTVAAVIFYLLGEAVEISFAPLLAIVAGFFIYIAVSDIIPTIHNHSKKKAIKLSLILLLAVIVVYFLTKTLHGLE